MSRKWHHVGLLLWCVEGDGGEYCAASTMRPADGYVYTWCENKYEQVPITLTAPTCPECLARLEEHVEEVNRDDE
jgi:hypothetical protein